jgi:hypothetical protein
MEEINEVQRLLKDTDEMASKQDWGQEPNDPVKQDLKRAVNAALDRLKARKRRMEIVKEVQERELKVSAPTFKKPGTLRFTGQEAVLEVDDERCILRPKESVWKFICKNPGDWNANHLVFYHTDEKKKTKVKVSIALGDVGDDVERVGGTFEQAKGRMADRYNELKVISE